MRRLAAAALALAGCAAGSTTVSVVVEIRPGDAAPSKLTASVFDAHHALARGPVAPGPLPGTVLVSGLPDVDQPLRIVVASEPALHELGGARVQTVARHAVSVTLLLSASTPDSDGDGVPDELDDCPTVFDPEQRSADGVTGDLCRGDGGAPDLAGGDGGGSFCGGPSRCAGSTASLCNGFESGALTPPWQELVTNGAQAVEMGRACRGQWAIHLSTTAVPAQTRVRALIYETQVAPQADFYLRAFVYLPSPQLSDGATLLTAYQLVQPYAAVDLLVSGHGKLFSDDAAGAGLPSRTSAASLPTDRWVCLELGVVSDPSNGQVRVWLDDSPLDDLSIGPPVDTRPSPNFGSFAVGMAWVPGPALPARDLWVDEVVLDTQRIGCAK